MAYKMKGFSGFKSSPVKISDKEVIKSQRKLNKVEAGYKEEGWAKTAGEVLGGGASDSGDSKDDSNGAPKEKKSKTVAERTKGGGTGTLKRTEIEGLKLGGSGGGGFGGASLDE